jgi:hypothetical protein
MRADNSRFIVQAAHDRHDEALQRAQDALRRLDRSGEPITFRSVAEAASVSRAWLYRQPVMRAEIERLRPTTRPNAPQPAIPVAQHSSAESLHQRLEGLHEQARQLREENRQLREQVARMFGDQRSHPHRHDDF